MWDLSCPDWEARIREGRSLMPDLPLFAEDARRAVAIFNKLHIPDVEGTPALADAAGDWFREIVGALFGSLDPASGQRKIRELLLVVPKKNSKTTGAAGLMLTALLLNKRPRAEFILTGPTQEVSDLAFSQVQGMIECDPDGFLQKRMHVQFHVKTITDRRTKARLKIKTFDASVATGPKPAGILVDELHETAKISHAASIIGQLRGGMISQPEAFLAFITTQSDQPPVGAFRAELMQARAIRDGTLKGVPMLPIIYEFPTEMLLGGEAAPWRDPANWWMVTPNRGRSVSIDRLTSDFTAAQAKGDAEIRRWASQHLNIEIGLALQSDAWAGAAFWERQAEPDLTLEALLDRSEVAVVGIDGGGLDDLLGLAVLGRDRDTRRWLHWSHTWAHRVVLERRKSEAARLQDFEAAGELTIVDEMGADVAGLADIVEQTAASGLLPEKNAIGVDPVGITDMIDALEERGIRNEPDKAPLIIGVPQGWKLNNAINTTGRRLVAGTLVHAGQAITNWAAGNCKAEARGSAITINKQTSGAAKIDPMIALFNAVALMSMNPVASAAVIERAEEVII